MSNLRIGIVGGGQLAALLVEEAQRQGTPCFVLDTDPACPACLKGAQLIPGDKHNPADLRQLVEAVDVTTVDLEDINVEALADLERHGHRILPRPATLRLITNKLRQKEAMVAAGIPTSPFVPYDGEDPAQLGALGWPAVQKAAEGGYDGRGVAIVASPEQANERLRVPGYIEAHVQDALELSVMVARNGLGDTSVWEPVEMSFDKRGNLLAYLIAPARIPAETAARASKLAVSTVAAFDGVGIFGVEMFLTPGNEILVNEIAPRTHNSGHYTIDACRTSQFLQQYHILLDQPLGNTEQVQPAVMFNLLGAMEFEGDTVVEGEVALAELRGVHLYLYGKQQCFPLRKMGHVTVVAETVEDALAVAETAKQCIVVRGNRRITT
ncbi:MAG: 5-(carboxyamino)imidazole ribonucleotide synthase [Pseudomonadota bacterium]